MFITEYIRFSHRCKFSALLQNSESPLSNQSHHKHCESKNSNFVSDGLPETGSVGLEPLSILHL